MSTRPRPRPKPRPRVASAAPPSSPGGTPGALPTTEPLAPVTINIEEDEDARFLKNRFRTLQAWKKLDKLTEEQETKKPGPSHSAQLQDQNDVQATPRRRKKVQEDSMPSWTKNAKAALLSSDEESDDSIEIVGSSIATGSGAGKLGKPNRKRSRSRSITPPPSLPSHTLEFARETVRRMLGQNARAPSPTNIGEDSLDNIELDPELAMIAMEAKRQTSVHPTGSRSASPETVGGGPEVVALKVRWRDHPLNKEGKGGVWAFRMKRHDSFSIMFSEVADIAGIPVDNIIVTYEGRRVFSSASPHGVGVWAQAELEACDKSTFDYMQKHRHRSPGPEASLDPIMHPRGASPADTGRESVAPSEGENDPEDDDTLKITLRAASLKSLTLTVRQTTKCSAVLKAFIKHHKLTDKYPDSPSKNKGGPALMVDGDRLNPESEISATDLEDGDMVEVVGL
ncbi:hypothetical protein BDW22DRAFT_1432089 [Trametopsis cervina]|nr:hypothetical protein BDW22DRAFT_1432089 [Trametopsis cervina]